MSPPLPEDTRRLRRSRRGRLAGGICRGLSLHLGANVWLVRLLFVLFTWIGGLGVLTYAAFWIFVPLGDIPEEDRSAPRPQVRLVLLALIALGILLLFGLPMRHPSNWRTILPLAAVALGLAVLWRQADDVQRAGDGGPRARTRSTTHLARAALGAAVAIGGMIALADGNNSWTETGRTLLAALALLVGAGLIGLPFFLRILRDLAHERTERARSQERAEVAALMHDSVLHTLTLIQRHHDDPAQVARLARAQERELREWLYGERKSAAESFAEAIRAAAAEVEDRHGARLEVVSVGDAPLDPQLEACVAAAREAMVNAAKYAPEAPISVYAELADDRVEVFVKDRGPGFDLDAVAPDRMGVRQSILGRMRRHGGQAEIRTAPGEGTEVRLTAKRVPQPSTGQSSAHQSSAGQQQSAGQPSPGQPSGNESSWNNEERSSGAERTVVEP
ncbi:PspC domain-containing protein [Actinospica sp.]|uniref:ATP-binding protein n=1 Tax=Actinospica sp. TaxID=1872142 RepID=UPI002CBC9C9A|nr:PspC domain-containing protein [Actinospica sp.]HWG23807.1 PspC domain-containing protein [Actinospica sp.]